MATDQMQQNWSNISSDITKLVCSLLGLSYFIYLIQKDARGAYKKRAYWIPGNAFVLSALTIQVLSYLNSSTTVNISDKPNFEEVAMLLSNHLLVDSGRLTICVFIGYLLPGMARSGSGADWGDIFALAISLLTDIVSELYFLHRSKYLFNIFNKKFYTISKVDYNNVYVIAKQLQDQPSIRAWYIVSSVGILLSVMLLILCLGCTVVAGNTIRGMLSQRIAAALSAKGLENSGEMFEDKVFKSWLLARACRPEHVIARSVLSSAVGMVVSLRIVLSLIKLSCLQYKNIIPYYDGLDELRQATFFLQCAFVFIGWIAICLRWTTALLYFPRTKNIRRFFVLEDFWTRPIVEFKYKCEEGGFFLRFEGMLVPSFLMGLQILVVFFSKVCWFLSEIAIGNQFMRGCVLGNPDLDYYTGFQKDAFNDYAEFDKQRKVLERVCMPLESAGNLWVANKKSIKQMKGLMEAGYQEGTTYHQLIALVTKRCESQDYSNGSLVNLPKFESLLLVKEYFPSMDKMCWKMTTVSYFKITVKLFPTSKRLVSAMEAFDQARDFMNILESSDIQENDMSFLDSLIVEGDQMSKAADREFNTVHKSVSSEENVSNFEAATTVINELLQSTKKSLNENGLLQHVEDAGLQDSRDLRKIGPSYNLYRVCSLCIDLLERNGDDVIELKDLQIKIEDQLDSVIAYCVLQVTAKLVKKCKEWARDFEEDKIWKTAYMAGKVKGVLDNCNVRPNWIDLQLPSSAEAADVPET